MRLSNQEIDFLLNELSISTLMNENEIKYMIKTHPQIYYNMGGKGGDGLSIFTQKSYIFSLNNHNLKFFLSNKFNEDINSVYSIHKLIYGVGGMAKRHRDKSTTYKSVSIVLSDNFKGGDMYINDKLVEMNSLGDYIIFNGSEDFHEVKEVTEGKREVLIVWFSKKEAKFNLI